MDNFEKHISRLLQNDKLPFSANTAFHSRLMYLLQLKSANSAVRKNEILPSLSALFTTKLIAWKVGFAALFLITFIGSRQFNHQTAITHVADTVQIVRSLDSTNFIMDDSVSFR
jgi:hypothetical protein